MIPVVTAPVIVPKELALPSCGGLICGPVDAAETLVYLHGWGGSKELWWNTLMHMGERYSGIALDLPGVGGTSPQQGRVSMRSMAQWVEQTCRRLNVSNITLVGHSLGGNLAAQVALDYPSLLRRLVLVDAALEPAHFPRRARLPLSPVYGMLALRAVRWLAWPSALAGRHIPHDHLGGHWQPYARRNHYYVTANTDAVMQQQLRALCENPHQASRLAELDLPTLIVHGARDAIIPAARARALAAEIPNSCLVIFPQAHHCPMDTDPVGFAKTLCEFLSV